MEKRKATKFFFFFFCLNKKQSTSKAVLATSGMQADAVALVALLRARLATYEQDTGREMPTTAIAQLLSVSLYYRRFFPYYTFNVLGGIDEQGKGVAYSYDAVGSFERVKYSSSGTGQSLVQPFLDNQVARLNQTIKSGAPASVDDVVDFVKDALTSAGERDIYTGDSIDIAVITGDGIRIQASPLKKD
jgi:20S proteasome subunit beta 6